MQSVTSATARLFSLHHAARLAEKYPSRRIGDGCRLGARIGLTLVLHTWGSALTRHPHVHAIIPGGGLSLDGERCVAIANSRLIVLDERGVTLTWKDYYAADYLGDAFAWMTDRAVTACRPATI